MTEPTGLPPGSPDRLWRLHIVRESREAVRILAMSGRIGVASAPLLAEAITEELESGQTRILLDLAGVDYVSSAGLLALQDAARLAREGGRRVALCNLSEPVRLAFELAGLTGHFTILPSCEDGVAQLGQDLPQA